MVYEVYDRGISRNNSQDAASRVANEIFHHDLQRAAMDTRGITSNLSGRDAQVFVNRVDQDLAQLNREYAQSPYGNRYGNQYRENQSGNYLSARQTYDRYGRAVEQIDMVSGDRIHHKTIADVPFQPYGRVPMNFSQYQPGESPPSPYYASQTPYSGWQNPGAPPQTYDYASNNPNYYAPNNPNNYSTNPNYYASNPNYANYGNGNYDYPQPVSYGYGGYQRHVQYAYGYGGGYGYDNGVNTSIAAGAIIGGVLARAFRI